MRVSERKPDDVAELRRRVRAESKALQRDRYRAVLLALEGEEAVAIRTGSTLTATAGSAGSSPGRGPGGRPSCHAIARPSCGRDWTRGRG